MAGYIEFDVDAATEFIGELEDIRAAVNTEEALTGEALAAMLDKIDALIVTVENSQGYGNIDTKSAGIRSVKLDEKKTAKRAQREKEKAALTANQIAEQKAKIHVYPR